METENQQAVRPSPPKTDSGRNPFIAFALVAALAVVLVLIVSELEKKQTPIMPLEQEQDTQPLSDVERIALQRMRRQEEETPPVVETPPARPAPAETVPPQPTPPAGKTYDRVEPRPETYARREPQPGVYGRLREERVPRTAPDRALPPPVDTETPPAGDPFGRPSREIYTDPAVPPVVNHPRDGSVRQVVQWLREHMRRPDTLEIIRWGKVTAMDGDIYSVRVIYGGNNEQGNYKVEDMTFFLNETGRVIGYPKPSWKNVYPKGSWVEPEDYQIRDRSLRTARP